jgi:uncharacterized protein (DUF427 family)
MFLRGELLGRGMLMIIDFVQPAPGQESVWDYPRPPQLETSPRHVVVKVGDVVVADTTSSIRYLETSNPPSFYVPAQDVKIDLLVDCGVSSPCEFRGVATYFDVVVDGQRFEEAAVSYLSPEPAYAAIGGYYAFFAGRGLECTLDGQPVFAQEGRYYCGWISDDVVGPFKGAPGTFNW